MWYPTIFFTFLQFPTLSRKQKKIVDFSAMAFIRNEKEKKETLFLVKLCCALVSFFMPFSRATKMPYNIHIITLNLKEMKEDVVFHFIFYFSAV